MPSSRKEYFREYRARKKYEKMAQQEPAPLFASVAKIGNGDDLKDRATISKRKNTAQNVAQQDRNSSMQQPTCCKRNNQGVVQPKTQQSQNVQHPQIDVAQLADEVSKRLSKIIEFPGTFKAQPPQFETQHPFEHDDDCPYADEYVAQQELQRQREAAQQIDELVQQLRNAQVDLDEKFATPEPEIKKPLQITSPLETIASQLRTNWKSILGMAVLVMFLTANTTFLVSEQFSFYRAFGYSLSWSLVIAVLSELALITFSALSSATKSWRWKLPMSVMSIATAGMILGVLSSNIEQRSSEQTAASEEVKSLKNKQASLEALRGSAIADMNSLDPQVYPSRRNDLRGKIEAWNFELSSLGDSLVTAKSATPDQTSSHESILKFQRALMMLWNLLLAGYLGYLVSNLRSKSECSV